MDLGEYITCHIKRVSRKHPVPCNSDLGDTICGKREPYLERFYIYVYSYMTTVTVLSVFIKVEDS